MKVSAIIGFTCFCLLLPGIGSSGAALAQPETLDSKQVLVTVNGEPVTEGDLQFMYLSRSVPVEVQPQVRRKMLEICVEHRLMKQYLAGRKAEAREEDVTAMVERIQNLIRRADAEPAEVLGRMGYTDQKLRGELSLPLSWSIQLQRMITDETLRDYYKTHQQEFDGTEVRARQVFLKAKTPEEQQQALQTLAELRQKITDRKLSFEEAVMQYSQSPSKQQAGDLGWFPYRGKMPEAYTRAAFALQKQELSQPFVTPFGVHLLQVTDRKAGTLSLEDVRGLVQARLSEELWAQVIEQERAKASIQWATTP